MSIITESEKKRLQSLREKKLAFKAKGQLIRQALSDLDNSTKDSIKNKKLIFDDDIDEEQNPRLRRNEKKDLFDNNDNEEEPLWNDDEFSFKKNRKIILGTDARFTLDNRFMEDDHQIQETEIPKSTGECDLQKEQERQLDILESILGTPLMIKNQDVKPATKGVMIRYDPTENGHREYEVKSVKLETKETNAKRKKRDKHVSEVEEPASVAVSKDVFYTVSDTLADSLKQKEEFSLLKVHGREIKNIKDNNVSTPGYNKQQASTFNFDVKNAFKYDSSDNENVNEVDKQVIDETRDVNCTNNLFEHKDTLFFDNNDVRFNEAIRFFKQEVISNNEFTNLRRKLKMIVRTKIHKNDKRQQPWGKKRKIRRS